MTVYDLIVYTVIVLCTVMLFACGNEALRMNASVAHVMLEVQSESGPRIREQRVAAGVHAGSEVHRRGGLEAEAQVAARQAASLWDCAIDGHRLYSIAVGTYIDTLSLWASGRDFGLAEMWPLLRGAVSTYRVLFSCLSSLGSSLLPEVPAFLSIIPPSWNVQAGE